MKVIDETSNDLRAMIEPDFGPLKVGPLHGAFTDWLHYKARSIPMIARNVVTSAAVSNHAVQYPAIAKIRHALETGQNVNPWLSNSTKTRKLRHNADMMFNDWQIIHFHLGNFFQSPSKIYRSGPLLFCHITATEATLLNVEPHKAWAKLELLEILLKENPSALERHEAHGVTPNRFTDEEYGNLRANGGNAIIEVGGRAFMPGMGRLSSGHAFRIVKYADWFSGQAEHFVKAFEADQIPDNLKIPIYARLGVPVRLGVIYRGGALTIVDKNRQNLVLHAMKPLE